jgi:hypothetical protein
MIFTISVFARETNFVLESKSSVYREITDSKTQFDFKKTDSNSIDTMSAKINFYNDSETKRNMSQFSFDGEKTTNNDKFNIGGEWNIPIYLYKYSPQQSNVGYEAAGLELGFAGRSANKNFPFGFSVGPAFEGGFNHLSQDFITDTILGFGGYFSVFGGDTSGSRILQTPFLFDGYVFAKFIKSQNDYRNTNSRARLIYEKNGLFNTDSLIISLCDTIILGEVNSQLGYLNGLRGSEIPNKYGNNLSFSLRATQIGDAFFEPSVEILASNNRYRYINSDKFYGSLKKNTISVFGFVEKEIGNWNFETGLKLLGAKEENCYLSSEKSAQFSKTDTLNEKLKDADVFNPQYYFAAKILPTKKNMEFSLKYSIERYKRSYPFFYKLDGVKFESYDDFDNVSNQIKFQSDFYFVDWHNFYFSAELLKFQNYYLKQQMSAASKTERRFALEAGSVFSKDSSIIFFVKGKAAATPQEYYFAEKENVPLPSHNRMFSLGSDLLLQYKNGWSNSLSLTHGKYDRGVIYNERYYGIETIKYETVSSVSFSKSSKFFVFSGGIESVRMNFYRFDEILNDYRSDGVSYRINPFVSCNAEIKEDFQLDFYAKRNINKGALSSTKNYWDLSLFFVWNK